jgi:hypothetical protein
MSFILRSTCTARSYDGYFQKQNLVLNGSVFTQLNRNIPDTRGFFLWKHAFLVQRKDPSIKNERSHMTFERKVYF